MYIFCYSSHNAILNVIVEVKNVTKVKGRKIAKTAFYIEFFVYTTVLFVGYLSTFENTNEIFIDRPDQTIYLVVGKLLYIISLTCHIALFYFISRPSIEMLLNKGKRFTVME
jgi:amino acid permease